MLNSFSKVLSIIFLLTLLSCSDDDKSESNEFRDSLISMYKLTSIDTDIPIDLNNDGIDQTDLWLEADCFLFQSFDTYFAEFEYMEWSDRKTFSIHIPYSYYDQLAGQYETCLVDTALVYEFSVNEAAKEILVTYRDEREDEFGVLTDIKYENNVLYVTYNKELYTSQGWKQVVLNMEFQQFDLNSLD